MNQGAFERGKRPAARSSSAQILLAADTGASAEESATAVGVVGSTVCRTKRRLCSAIWSWRCGRSRLADLVDAKGLLSARKLALGDAWCADQCNELEARVDLLGVSDQAVGGIPTFFGFKSAPDDEHCEAGVVAGIPG